MDWITANWSSVFDVITRIVGIAAIISALTPNTSDNKAVDLVLNILNALGGNVGKATNAE
jgi:hypothetical protein